ncbi:hypothetical protein H650_03575 [Enterobacter sp. R4-368]|nr:hypothetical protein H650_03575 [Enterobacter sp. R4-368]
MIQGGILVFTFQALDTKQALCGKYTAAWLLLLVPDVQDLFCF